LRFKDERPLVIPLHFFVLTALLLTPVLNGDALSEFPIGWLRYFGLLSILPAIHILFEIHDRSPARIPLLASTGVQVFILLLALNIRSASSYLLLGVLAIAALAYRRNDFETLRLTIVAKVSGAVSLLLLFAILVYATAPTDYRAESRVTGVFWHRILIGLGTNSGWPFGALAARYESCNPRLQTGVSDSTGGCVWTQYALSKGMTPAELQRGYYGGTYEKVVRDVLFGIAAEYPHDVFKSFWYYKYKYAAHEFKHFLRLDFNVLEPRRRILFICFLIQFCVLVIAARGRNKLQSRKSLEGAGIFLLCSAVPVFVAWGTVHTLVDFVYWVLGVFVCTTLALLDWSRAGFRPMPSLIFGGKAKPQSVPV
jgi:hypothetical protein